MADNWRGRGIAQSHGPCRVEAIYQQQWRRPEALPLGEAEEQPQRNLFHRSEPGTSTAAGSSRPVSPRPERQMDLRWANEQTKTQQLLEQQKDKNAQLFSRITKLSEENSRLRHSLKAAQSEIVDLRRAEDETNGQVTDLVEDAALLQHEVGQQRDNAQQSVRGLQQQLNIATREAYEAQKVQSLAQNEAYEAQIAQSVAQTQAYDANMALLDLESRLRSAGLDNLVTESTTRPLSRAYGGGTQERLRSRNAYFGRFGDL